MEHTAQLSNSLANAARPVGAARPDSADDADSPQSLRELLQRLWGALYRNRQTILSVTVLCGTICGARELSCQQHIQVDKKRSPLRLSHRATPCPAECMAISFCLSMPLHRSVRAHTRED